jgi:3-oxoacyl-[acyl-carrier-protein] synthase-3
MEPLRAPVAGWGYALPIFGDAAGAVVLAPSAGSPTGPGLLAWDTGSDGSQTSLIEVPAGGSRHPPTLETLAAGAH